MENLRQHALRLLRLHFEKKPRCLGLLWLAVPGTPAVLCLFTREIPGKVADLGVLSGHLAGGAALAVLAVLHRLGVLGGVLARGAASAILGIGGPARDEQRRPPLEIHQVLHLEGLVAGDVPQSDGFEAVVFLGGDPDLSWELPSKTHDEDRQRHAPHVGVLLHVRQEVGAARPLGSRLPDLEAHNLISDPHAGFEGRAASVQVLDEKPASAVRHQGHVFVGRLAEPVVYHDADRAGDALAVVMPLQGIARKQRRVLHRGKEESQERHGGK
mmetsp:Transcript_91889/g.274161  ORF Transcript_91889/g.274161 Transcript_91889/m.274161 type:complete len:271 (-) Transcript_91889:560-1372(-)